MTDPTNNAPNPIHPLQTHPVGRQVEAPGLPPIASVEAQLALVERLIDLVPDFFYVHTYDMRFAWANRHAATYFGTTKDVVIGKRLDEVDANKEQARFFIEVCQRVMREGVSRLTDNLPYRRPDGSTGFLRQHDIPFDHPITGERMLLGMSRDVRGVANAGNARERRGCAAEPDRRGYSRRGASLRQRPRVRRRRDDRGRRARRGDRALSSAPADEHAVEV